MSNIKIENRRIGSGISKYNSCQKAARKGKREDRRRAREDAAVREACREVTEAIGIGSLSTIAAAAALPLVGAIGAFGVGAAACSALYVFRKSRHVEQGV